MRDKQITLQKFVGIEDKTQCYYRLSLGSENVDMTPVKLLELIRNLTAAMYEQTPIDVETNPTRKH